MDGDIEEESRKLEKALVSLADCEHKMDEAETDATIYRLKKTQSIYRERRDILRSIPKFWYIVLAEHEDFSEYILPEDSKFVECIEDLYVHYPIVDLDSANPRDFSITITFNDHENKSALIPEQTLTKHFKTEVKDGEEVITSTPVEIEWPKAFSDINPATIKQNSNGSLTEDEKKRYRKGMRSFFSWFSWTGTKPGKEFRSGDDFTRLLVEDVFPYAVKYYTEALPGEISDEVDSSEGEELDLSDSSNASDTKDSETNNKDEVHNNSEEVEMRSQKRKRLA